VTAGGAVEPVPLKSAGRFWHEAVAWHNDVLYLTEDKRYDAAFYRWLPERTPARAGELGRISGALQALKFVDVPNANTDGGPIGKPFDVEWVTIPDPDPDTDTVRDAAHDLEAAGLQPAGGHLARRWRIYFDCTEGGVAGLGQVWELNPRSQQLTLVYESPGPSSSRTPTTSSSRPRGTSSCARTRTLRST
jgi:uncharacterized protein